MTFIKTPAERADRIAAGEAIIRLSASVFKTGPANARTEWQIFDENPGAWLHALGYRLTGPGAPADGKIMPDLMQIIPVYDTANKMHVRIPWTGDLDRTVQLPDATEYAASFPAFLASYFTRRCR